MSARGFGRTAARRLLPLLALLGLLALQMLPPTLCSARAARVAAVSPEGEVALVRQVLIRFDQAVVAAGDPRAAAPATVRCDGQMPAGRGRWLDERRWALDFDEALPPGLRCSVALRAGWQPLDGSVSGRTEFAFSTAGAAVLQTQPWSGATIDEDQHFILRMNGAVPADEVARRGACEIEGLGERLPLRVLEGPARAALLKARGLDRDLRAAGRTLVVSCGRPLPAGARMQLVWRGAGAAAGTTSSQDEQRYDFRVREAFTAEFSCERERASAPCLPVRPLVVRFSAPVSREQAQALRLRPAGGGQTLAPTFDPDDRVQEFDEVSFKGPFAENARYVVELPARLQDTSGRMLANAASFPLAVSTGEAPPLAKFAAAPFGVLEALPEPLLPITLRRVQGDLQPDAAGGLVRVKRIAGDAEIITWTRKLRRWHEARISAREAGLPPSQWHEWIEERDARGRVVRRRVDRMIGTRELPLLAGDPDARRLLLPQLAGNEPRPLEVVGLPLPGRGYQVVELESRRLGQALLDPAAPMFVRTGVLVTDLSVHFKRGRENALVWVTSLSRGQPVAGAEVAISDCRGQRLWSGRSDAAGLARVPLQLQPPADCDDGESFFVSARKTVAEGPDKGATDMAFVFDGWNKGIEPWRFPLPTSDDPQPDERAHTVFDRTLLRAGETVSMKHFIRRETGKGLALLPASQLPTQVKIVHEGSGEEWVQPLSWPGGRSATSEWRIPPAARLGAYRVELERPAVGDGADAGVRSWTSGSFRVEAYRVPLVDARLLPPKGAAVAPRELAFGVQLDWGSGGAVARLPLQGSALLRPRTPSFAGYDEFSFSPPRAVAPDGTSSEEDDETEDAADAGRVIANRVALTTDAQGGARFVVADLPALEAPAALVAEVAFNDPNGETQTVSTTTPLWPATVVPGIRTAGWAARRGQARFTALALSTEGRPLAGQALEVHGRLRQHTATRKRLVGGFYAYEHRTELKDLGLLCSGRSDANGRLECAANLAQAGEVELVVSARDASGHQAQAAASVWVTRQGELWFEQDNDDRIDLLPEKRRYAPGETARLQVRMPYREATALVTVEREGVIDARVQLLRGDDPHVELGIDGAFAPNVYVSVLVLRGRVRDVPWTSFFRWGWRSPLEWARAFPSERPDYQPPTAMVDLSRPSFKLGTAALSVGLAAHELQVTVLPQRSQAQVRETVPVRVRVTRGVQPVPGAEIAFAAVDEALLALRENESWQLLQGMMQPRPWGVQTATAQGEVIGRRHYGRKAVPAGGGGGHAATRELFDTLLLWRPRVQLDARGEAELQLPLKDSLTRFRLVAVADDGGERFGTGSAGITVTQDLQILAGLPPQVREGDRFSALVTLRNATRRTMSVRATLQGHATLADGSTRSLSTEPRDLQLPAGAGQELAWPVEVPAGATSIRWEASVAEQGGSAGAAASPVRDRLRVTQAVSPAVPPRVLQATLLQLDGAYTLPVQRPQGALPGGGLDLALRPRLGGTLPGLTRFFESYPYTCLEQSAAKAIGLHDAKRWQALVDTLPTYLDDDGLAAYFPPRAGDAARGSDRLTAHLLAVADASGMALPPALAERMLDGLLAFVEGRIERRFWSPRPDLQVRKLAAIEALSRYGRATPRLLGSIAIEPAQWPTAALVDWLQILRRVDALPLRTQHLAQAQQLLRARLVAGGTTLQFADRGEQDWWWLMDSADANAARLILAVLDEPAWQEDLPRLLSGALARQRRGAWGTTVANTWGVLALDAFGRRFEVLAPTGRTSADLFAAGQAPAAAQAAHDHAAHEWTASPAGGVLHLPWPEQPGELVVRHQGQGKPWLAVQALAALPLDGPLEAGFRIARSVHPVQQADPARWSRGDVVRVRLQIDAAADRTWVVVSDPVPAGATILGSGLGRDSALATQGEQDEGNAWPAYDERGFDAFRRYFEFMPRGRHVVEYTLRLNNPGRFLLPPTRVEALYAPESFGEAPNAAIEIAE